MKSNRWFIWTIVFLVAAGVSLVSYISLSDQTYADWSAVSQRQIEKHSVKPIK